MLTNVHGPGPLTELSSDVITTRLSELRSSERLSLVEFLWYLGEMDRRRSYLDLGYPSLFAYCTDALGLPKASAFRRTTSARLLSRFPIAAEYLADGRLCLTTFVLLKDVLQEVNHRDLLDRAAGRSEEQVEVLVASLRPRPEVSESIRRVPIRAPAPVESLFSGSGPELTGTATTDSSSGPEPTSVAPPPRPQVRPIDAERHSLKMTVGREFMEELAQVKSALSHVVPDGNLEALLRVCFQKTLEAYARRQRAARSAPAEAPPQAPVSSGPELKTPRPPQGERRSRSIPAEVKREVWERDRGSCSFIGTEGRRCGSTYQLELDHLKPFALGGEHSAANLALRCRQHNLHSAAAWFGDVHMNQFQREGRNR
jgi:hypothetical protein